MVIMALDHVRDYFTAPALDPTDLSHTTFALFMTRFITHFCAPVFIFLAGSSAYLSRKPRRELAAFLFTRGLFIVLLELTVMRFGWSFDVHYHSLFLITLWAIGWSMVALGGLVLLPVGAVGAIGVAMIFSHNAFDHVHGGLGWSLLHAHYRGDVAGVRVIVGYPLVPWIGVMAAGYAFGTMLGEQKRKQRLWLGISMIVAFVVLRTSNLYGDPHPWSAQATPLFTVLSFLNCEKYPPSLCYLLMTLGPSLLLLVALERVRVSDEHPLHVFGRVPMFYYILHIYLIHLIACAVFAPRYGLAVFGFGVMQRPADYGLPLGFTYLVWIGCVVGLYPVCRWYAALKRRSRSVWLSYL